MTKKNSVAAKGKSVVSAIPAANASQKRLNQLNTLSPTFIANDRIVLLLLQRHDVDISSSSIVASAFQASFQVSNVFNRYPLIPGRILIVHRITKVMNKPP